MRAVKIVGVLLYETLLSGSDKALKLSDVRHPGAESALQGPMGEFFGFPTLHYS